MVEHPQVLWLNTSPVMKRFHRPLLRQLARQTRVIEWEYRLTQDEANSLDEAVKLLHEYVGTSQEPLHLLGHGTSGLVGLLYARQYSDRVASLTLLSVGVQAAINWHAHYYVQRQLLRCDRQIILSQMVFNLFGRQPLAKHNRLCELLQQDLDSSLSPHSLYQRASVAVGGIERPLMICGAQDDRIVDTIALSNWQTWLKSQDRLWCCPSGRHFFHYIYPERVAEQILDFWHSLQPVSVTSGS